MLRFLFSILLSSCATGACSPLGPAPASLSSALLLVDEVDLGLDVLDVSEVLLSAAVLMDGVVGGVAAALGLVADPATAGPRGDDAGVLSGCRVAWVLEAW